MSAPQTEETRTGLKSFSTSVCGNRVSFYFLQKLTDQ